MKKLVIAGLLVLAVIAAACGGDGEDSPGAHMDGGSGHGMGTGEVPGEAADESEADRTVNIEALDELAFSPDTFSVEAGEVVTFEVTNGGQAVHEFVLGDEGFQAMHGQDMSDGHVDDMDHLRNGITLAPGESGSLTWRFTERGEVLFGCHLPGHYEGGMHGSIVVG